MFEELVRLLIEKGYTISAAESCTGGLFASGIVSVPDASKVLDRSFVTYSEKAKSELAGVSPAVMERYGVVSEETAAEMARGAAGAASSDVGVGITGFAGPSGGDAFADRGTVCFGFFLRGETYTARMRCPDCDRNTVRAKSVEFACRYLIDRLK